MQFIYRKINIYTHVIIIIIASWLVVYLSIGGGGVDKSVHFQNNTSPVLKTTQTK